MNERWASYWHARLLREADFLPHDLYLDAIKTHSDVVRPQAGEHQAALDINVGVDGSLILRHDHRSHTCGLDIERARRVLGYIHPVWRRKVVLYTVDAQGEDVVLREGKSGVRESS